MSKVFGLGFSKTGTTSLENALEILGYSVCEGHWNLKYYDYLLALSIHKDYPEIHKMTRYWDAFADAPWGGTDLYKKLLKWYPDAKFILTVRDTDSWYNSLEAMLTRFDKNLSTALESWHLNGRYRSAYYFKTIFEINSLAGNKKRIKDCFEKHNEEVVQFFSDKGVRLLLLNIIDKDGWEKLCPFLGVKQPKTNFPYLNAAKDRKSNV